MKLSENLINISFSRQHSTLFSGVVKPLEKAVTDKLLKLLSGDITNIDFNEEESEMHKNSKHLANIINKYENQNLLPKKFIERVTCFIPKAKPKKILS